MRLEGSRRSENVEDRRGMGITRGVQIGGAGGLGLVLLVVLAVVFGVDPNALLQTGIESSLNWFCRGLQGGNPVTYNTFSR